MSFNELAISFKKIVDDLFSSQGFECRKLFYGDEVFYCGRDILSCLKYISNDKNVSKTLNKLREQDKFTIKDLQEKYSSHGFKLSDDPNKELISSLNQYEMQHIYINTNGLKTLLSTTIKPIPPVLLELCKILNLEINSKMLRYEQETIASLLKVFSKEKYSLQYNVDGYRIDLYFPEYNLAIECDESGHKQYDQDKEKERERYIKKKIKCHFIRYNPNEECFDILDVVSQIHYFILKKRSNLFLRKVLDCLTGR